MVFLKSYFVNTTSEIDILNISSEVKYAIRDSGAKDGLLTVTVPGAGASVTSFEPIKELFDELRSLLSALAGNGSEGTDKRKEKVPVSPRLQASLMGRSISLPLKDGRPALDPYEEVFLIDMEPKARRREFLVQVMGEAPEDEASRGKPQQKRR